ncbi:MAG TPA: lysylphosphatidylglycerol synthase transmembrane domain-containing protein [Candidatus Bathyarchaeia archaeon]|nr:lysylphosphatidylglycerol synthase transmembrane domain-containing protein [Candidatus Bathyarchaeia archaeon]
MVIMIGALLWYVGIDTLVTVLKSTNPFYLLLAFLSYSVINVIFTIRIIRVLQRQGIKATFWKTILAQYAGMLSSDVTPGRSGYMLTSVYLKDQGIETSSSLSCIFGIQSIEFLVKVIGGALALLYLLNQTVLTGELFWIASVGIGLMLLGGFALAAIIWFPKTAGLIRRIAGLKLLSRFTAGIMGKLGEFAENSMKTRSAIPEITLFTLLSWIVKGFEWYFLGLAVGITNIGWLGFFLIHPLVTAFGFVPFTPSGIGFQEGAIVGVFLLLGVDIRLALVFAILSRALLIIEDLVGVPQIAKSTQHGLFATTRLVQRNKA